MTVAHAESSVLAATFALAEVGLAQLDEDLRVERVNDRLLRLTGGTTRAAIGRHVDEVLPLSPRPSVLLARPDGPRGELATVPGPRGGRRRVRVVCTPLVDASSRRTGQLLSVDDVTDVLLAERGRRRMLRRLTCLAAAGELPHDLDADAALQEIARVAVEHLADWCVISLPSDDGDLRTVAAAHRDPRRTDVIRRLADRHPSAIDASRGAPAVLRSGRPELYDELPGELLDAAATSAEHRALLRSLDPRSVAIAPLTLRGRTLGTLTLISSRAGRVLDWNDVRTAEELGRRAALALDAAQRHRATDRARVDAESSLESERRDHRALQAALKRRTVLQEVSTALQVALDAEAMVAAAVDLLVPWIADGARVVVRAPHLGELDHASAEPPDRGADTVPVHRGFTAGREAIEVRLTCRWDALGGPDEDDADLLQEVTDRLASACAVSEAYAAQARMARTLQASLLPAALPRVPGAVISARYVPAGPDAEVGGDFYDVLPLGDGTWMLAVGDVCGKGPEAAAVTARARHTLRAVAMDAPSPAAALRALNRMLLRQRVDDRFVTIAALRLHEPLADRVRIEVACAGHPPPVVLRADGGGHAVPAAGQLIGVFDDIDVTGVDLDLRAGDVLALFTDGLSEADPHARLEAPDIVEAIAHTAGDGPDATAAAIERLARGRAPGGRLPDDLAILAVGLDG